MAVAGPSFAQLLRHHRLSAGLTQELLAEEAGLSVHGIQKLERGGSQPHRETLRRLATALELSTEDEAIFLASGQPAPRNRGPHEPTAPDLPVADLPVALTSFIGRERELAELADLLPNTRLLTLTGIGGCGKTRLALEVARLMSTRKVYPDGVWLVELASLTDPALVAQAVATAFGIRETPTQGFLQTLISRLKGRGVLLVLDNCEHLLDECAQLANGLLLACPTVAILATSREALAVNGEVSRRVPSLAVPPTDSASAPDQLLGHAAARLFVERARAVDPQFEITPRNAHAIAQICRRLDGLPLALELAAARVAGLSVEELAARLDQRFRLLTGGSRAALPRQQTLRAAIDWSYELLSAPERALFSRLAVFSGTWTIAATEAVCAGAGIDREAVLQLLMRLVDKSLVLAEEDDQGNRRYRLLETLRQYAREQLLASGRPEAVYDEHAAYYLELARSLERQLGEAHQQAWIQHIARDESNLRRALEWLEGRSNVDQALELAAALWRFWEIRGYLSEGRGRLHAVLALPGASAPSVARARVLDGAGVLALYQFDLASARALFKESLALYRRLGHERGTAWVLMHLGWMCHDSARFRAARRCLRQALALAQRIGEQAVVARCLTLLGMLACGELDFASARALHEQSLALNRGAGDRWGTAWALHVLAKDQLWQVEAGEATVEAVRSGLEESAAIFRELGERRHQAHANLDLGLLAIREGNLREARRRLDGSLATFLELDLESDKVTVFYAYADLFATCKDLRRVARIYGFLSTFMPRLGINTSPLRRKRTEQHMALARGALPASRLLAEWSSGQALSLAEAVALVSESAGSARPHAEQKQAGDGCHQQRQPGNDEGDHRHTPRALTGARQSAVADIGDQRDRARAEAGSQNRVRGHTGPLP